ncbi:TIR domain-containing protein [Actinomadura scrupuli]|uniref:TIR domain-containing protein n=1 Tax=Actinomadura scrupuli TaxID=559629 RepID=UPI003D960FFC
MTARPTTSIVARFSDQVDDLARDDLAAALREDGFTVGAGLPLGHRGAVADVVFAALNCGFAVPEVITDLAVVVREWLRTRPRYTTDGGRIVVEIEDRATAVVVRITADDPDDALPLLRETLRDTGGGTANEPIGWLGTSWGTGRPEVERRRTVFVVHGRDKRARKELFVFLRAIGLHPIEWAQALAETGEGAPYVGQVLEVILTVGRAVVVLMTPDDIAYLKPEHGDDAQDPDLTPCGQARPNVLFEAGMAFASFGRQTVVVQSGKVRPFTDIDGRNVVRLDNSPQKRKLLAQRLSDIGCAVDLRGSDWLSVGNLTPPA